MSIFRINNFIFKTLSTRLLVDFMVLIFKAEIKPFKKKLKWLFVSMFLAYKYPSDRLQNTVPASSLNSPIWRGMNQLLRFNLKYINLQGLIKSPVVVAVTSPNMFNYLSQFKHETNLNIRKSTKIYSDIFEVDQDKFKNALMYYLKIIDELFQSANLDYFEGSSILQIGPGLGILDFFMYLEGANLYSFETPEMNYFQELIQSRINELDSSIQFRFQNISKIQKPFGVISFFAFTEMDMPTRDELQLVMRSADWIIIVSNEYFEGISNFNYLEKVFDSEFDLKNTFALDQIEIEGMMNYAKKHRAFLFTKKNVMPAYVIT